MRVRIEGLNLEKLLRLAGDEGIVLRNMARSGVRSMDAEIPFWQMKRLSAVCARVGWDEQVLYFDWPARFWRMLGRRKMLPFAAGIFVLGVFLSSKMVFRVRIEHAGADIGEVRTVLAEQGIGFGAWQGAHPVGALSDALALRLPGLAFVSARYAGSTLVIDCMPELSGEVLDKGGTGRDLVAMQDGVIAKIVARAGTPLVQPGEAVRRGQVLIRGEEKSGREEVRPVIAQGEVLARVWARGDAKTALFTKELVPTGNTRMRRTFVTPWGSRVTRDAQPFGVQLMETSITPLVGLYLPVYWKIEAFFEAESEINRRDENAARSIAEGAAEEIAKKKCPSDAIILDKCVNYSMIDNEFLYATVVLEYEQEIARRPGR